jgi:hypothetical protein
MDPENYCIDLHAESGDHAKDQRSSRYTGSNMANMDAIMTLAERYGRSWWRLRTRTRRQVEW